MDKTAEALDDVSEPDSSPICRCYMQLVLCLLTGATIVLPILFCGTPFKLMKPDPYFQSFVTADNFQDAFVTALNATAHGLAEL